MAHIAPYVHLSFEFVSVSKQFFFFSVQFILNELSLSHFLNFDILIKISSIESLVTYQIENRKNIPTVSEFDETFLGHWIS